jgi:serine protease Do
MKRPLLLLIPALAAAAAPPGPPAAGPDLREELRALVAQARDRVFPALVNIRAITVRYWDGKERKGASVGSGTIIAPDGYVLTNFHVVDNGRKFTCTLSDKREVPATLVGEDPLTDLAVLKLDLSKLPEPRTVPFARFGDSDALHVGDTVMAMGSPLALSRSVTLGIVSNTERILAAGDDDAEEMYIDRDQTTGMFNRWIQHDASISPGNSGGPLVNLQGEIVGVNARGIFGGGDLGFAIPGNVARGVAETLIARGEVERSWLGLSFKPIKKTGLEEGVLVNSVVRGGPADRGGVRAGDVIVAIDGAPVTVRFPEEIPPLLKRLAEHPVGSAIAMGYRRGAESGTATVVTEKLAKDRGDEGAFPRFGMTAEEITKRMAHERRLDSTKGVIVTSVRGGGPAALAEPPLVPGDVVRAIAGEPVDDLPAFRTAYDAIMERDPLPKYVLLAFDRQGKDNLTLLEPKVDEDVSPPQEVPKAWIGVALQPVLPRLAEHMGDPKGLGFRVTRVYPGTRAAESDLQAGDIIVALNGEAVRPRGMQDAGLFQRKVRALEEGGTATLTVLRGGAERSVEVRLERTRLTPPEAKRDHNLDFELTVREVTFFDRDENRWGDDVQGVIVVDVEGAGWAGLAGVGPGDLIQRIGDRAVGTIEEYRSALAELAEKKPPRVVFVVLRGVRTHFQYAEPDWGAGGDPDPDQGEQQ